MAGLWEEGAKLLGKVISKGEKGAKLTVEWSSKTGKALNGSKSIIKHDLTEGKVLSRPMAEANKSEAFMKKFGDVTYKTKDGKTASRFSYSSGKVHDHKLGESFSTREFPDRLSAARKELLESTGKSAKTSGSLVKSDKMGYLRGFAERHQKIEGAVAAAGLGFGALGLAKGYKAVSGDTITGSVLDAFVPDEGVGNGVGKIILGKEDYAAFRESFASALQELKSVYGSGKNLVSDVVGEGGDLYRNAKNELGNGYGYAKDEILRYLGPGYNANNYVMDENGNYVDTTTQPYPNMTNGTGGVTGQISDLTKKLAGDGVTPMNLATLLLSGYMMFCRAGWMSKAAGMLMGGMTMKSVGNHRQQMMQNGQAQGQSQANQQVRPDYNVAAVDNENRETYHVSRGM